MGKPSFRSAPELAYAQYLEDGYFVEDAVISPEDCHQLIAAAWELPDAKQGDLKPAMQPHRLNPLFLNTVRLPTIVSTIERLIGGRGVGLQTEFFYCKPGVRGFAKHQDNYFVEAPDDSFASAWIALTDVSPENGGLYGYPGSHKEGRLPVRPIDVGVVAGQDPNANNEETIIPDRYQAVDIMARTGSVVFLHSQFVHASRANNSQDFRYALLCTYIREGAPFRPGRYAQRGPIPLTQANVVI